MNQPCTCSAKTLKKCRKKWGYNKLVVRKNGHENAPLQGDGAQNKTPLSLMGFGRWPQILKSIDHLELFMLPVDKKLAYTSHPWKKRRKKKRTYIYIYVCVQKCPKERGFSCCLQKLQHQFHGERFTHWYNMSLWFLFRPTDSTYFGTRNSLLSNRISKFDRGPLLKIQWSWRGEIYPNHPFIYPSWWFQPIWKILVKLGIFPK